MNPVDRAKKDTVTAPVLRLKNKKLLRYSQLNPVPDRAVK